MSVLSLTQPPRRDTHINPPQDLLERLSNLTACLPTSEDRLDTVQLFTRIFDIHHNQFPTSSHERAVLCAQAAHLTEENRVGFAEFARDWLSDEVAARQNRARERRARRQRTESQGGWGGWGGRGFGRITRRHDHGRGDRPTTRARGGGGGGAATAVTARMRGGMTQGGGGGGAATAVTARMRGGMTQGGGRSRGGQLTGETILPVLRSSIPNMLDWSELLADHVGHEERRILDETVWRSDHFTSGDGEGQGEGEGEDEDEDEDEDESTSDEEEEQEGGWDSP